MNRAVPVGILMIGAALVACSSSGAGDARVHGTSNAAWGIGAGGPGVNPIGVAEKVIALIAGSCPDPTTESECPDGSGCCPDALECCSDGPNAGMCAPDCSASYESNGCESDYPNLCGDVCCPGDCNATGDDCADAVDTSSSGGSGGSCDGAGAMCGNCCGSCDPNTNTCLDDTSGSGSGSDSSGSGSGSDGSGSGSGSSGTGSSSSGGCGNSGDGCSSDSDCCSGSCQDDGTCA